MFSYGEKFKELWAEIPTITTYWNYIGIANSIDDALTRKEITPKDEAILIQALELFTQSRGIILE